MITFFVHKFNDIDHMSPIVYEIAKDLNKKVQILCLNMSYDIYKDYRLNYLSKKKNIFISYYYTIYTPSIFYKILGFLLCRKKTIFSFIPKISMKLISLFKIDINKLIQTLYNEKWVEGLYEFIKPSVLVFDHATHQDLYNMRTLNKIAKKYSIPTIDVPHGIPLYANHPKRWDKAKSIYLNNVKDHMVLHHKWWEKELNDIGLNKLQTPILGSARYCNEWIEKINEILPSDSSLKNLGKDKLKVLYMDLPHYKEYNPKFSQELINQILSLNFTYTIVKPQTRSNKMTFETNEKVYIANDENSVNTAIYYFKFIIIIFFEISKKI